MTTYHTKVGNEHLIRVVIMEDGLVFEATSQKENIFDALTVAQLKAQFAQRRSRRERGLLKDPSGDNTCLDERVRWLMRVKQVQTQNEG